MNEDYWYYEEQQKDGFWIDAYARYRFSQGEALYRMEEHKKANPSAKLRLVHVTRTRTPYAKRRTAK